MVKLKNFSHHSDLIHGFSTRKFGDLKVRKGQFPKATGKFVKSLGVTMQDLVMMEQVYQDRVMVVGNGEKGKVVEGADGLVARGSEIFLGVNSADCLPILFYEPMAKVVAVAHGSWQTLLARIAQKTVEKMLDLGAKPQNIYLGIGPHIGSCCYDVDKKRAALFVKEFNSNSQVLKKDRGKYFLDLAQVTLKQVLPLGVLADHIKISPLCTSCQNDQFFSFRKEGKIMGEILGVIGFKNA